MRLDDIVPLHMAELRYPESHPLAGTSGPVFAYAIRHPAGTVLFDTGIGPPHPRIDALYQPARTEIRTALYAAGFDPHRVAAIAISHLHFDHGGGIADFAGVPIHVQRAEYEAARAPRYTIPGWVDVPGVQYELHDGDYDLAEGVRLVSSPGHTPGHQSTVIQTDDGPVVLTGQAVQTAADYEAGIAIDPNDPIAVASLERIRVLEPALAWISHDAQPWRSR